MTIDEAIKDLKMIADYQEYEYGEDTYKMYMQVIEWLEELKEYRKRESFFNFDAVIKLEKEKSYNKAIDDFAKEMKKYWNGMAAMDEIIKVAKHLKDETEQHVDCLYKSIYNKAIDDFTDYIRPIISEYVFALKNNRYAFIDIGVINRKLKESVNNESIFKS